MSTLATSEATLPENFDTWLHDRNAVGLAQVEEALVKAEKGSLFSKIKQILLESHPDNLDGATARIITLIESRPTTLAALRHD